MVDIEPLFGPKIRITTALAFTVYVHIPIRKSGSEIQTQIVGYNALAVCYEQDIVQSVVAHEYTHSCGYMGHP